MTLLSHTDFGSAISPQVPPRSHRTQGLRSEPQPTVNLENSSSIITVENPPDYYEGLPTYRVQHEQTPVTSYTFYQLDKNTQILQSDPDSRLKNGYTIQYGGNSGIFSKKPDITLIQTSTPREAYREGWDDIIHMNKTVATATLQRASARSPIPRAHISQGEKTYTMECKDAANWTFTVDKLEFSWRIDNDPPSFILENSSSDAMLTRFTFGTMGTLATKGAEIGEFAIFGGHQSNEQSMIELLILSYCVAVQYHTNKGVVFKTHKQNASYRTLKSMKDNTLRTAVMAMSGRAWNVS